MNPILSMRIKYRQAVTMVQRLGLAGPPLQIVMRHLALNGKTGPIRLAAARRLPNDDLLRRLAREAAEEDVRLKAATLTREQSALTAFALRAWDIDMGETAVDHIANNFLLMRIARSARQDPIRLAAAIKLHSPRMLRQLAHSTTDINVRWRVAQMLADPHLMAQVAFFKTSNERLAPLRHQARQALVNHFEILQKEGNQSALVSLFFNQPNLIIKLDVFNRLDRHGIQTALLRHLAHYDFEHVAQNLIASMLDHLNSAGWQTTGRVQTLACRHCLGQGTLSDRSIIVHQRQYDSERLPCSECNGIGHTWLNVVTCTQRCGEPVILKLPLAKGPNAIRMSP